MNIIKRIFLLAVAVAILAVTPGFAAEPLRILLTNDDGYNAPGITAVRMALLNAGHNVTVVAPLANQSGSGIRLTARGTLNYKEQESGIWSVDGSPADAVLIGLQHIMKEQQPDLVVSGANFGQNLGYGSSSGTVGAATIAMYRGYPAIAISVGIRPEERNATPRPFAATFNAFPGAADLVVDLIQELQSSHRDLLPKHTILNVNYPAISPEEIQGIRVLQSNKGSGGIQVGYEETENPSVLRAQISFLPPDPDDDRQNDVQLFGRGYVVITVFDGDWNASGSVRQSVASRLSGLRD